MVTLKAAEVLSLCRQIHFSLSTLDVDEERDEWRIFWIAGLCMLRTVGQVLDKVDARTSPLLAEVISEKWKTLKSDRDANWIFWQFIDKERDNILKEFQLGAVATPLVGLFSLDDLPDVAPDLGELTGHIHWELMTDDGMTAIDLFEEALLFWSEYLKSIENEFEFRTQPSP